MLTKKKLKVYRRYEGDGDAWVRSFSWNKNAMTADEWATIVQLIGEIKMINKGLAAVSYKQTVLEKVRANCEDEETVEALPEACERDVVCASTVYEKQRFYK